MQLFFRKCQLFQESVNFSRKRVNYSRKRVNFCRIKSQPFQEKMTGRRYTLQCYSGNPRWPQILKDILIFIYYIYNIYIIYKYKIYFYSKTVDSVYFDCSTVTCSAWKVENVEKGTVPFSTFGGAGGSRTLVQTGKPYAFYRLISDWIVGNRLGRSNRAWTLSSKFSFMTRSRQELSPIWLHHRIDELRSKSFRVMSCHST